MVRSVQAHDVVGLPPLIPPNPEPAQPPSFAVLSPAASQEPTIRPPNVGDVGLPRATTGLPENVSAGALGLTVNDSLPDAEPDVPSALSADILSGPFPGPAASSRSEDNRSEAAPAPFVPEEGTGTLPPYYIVVNTTTTSSPTIMPLPTLTSEEEAAMRANRSAAAMDCLLGIWNDWSACEKFAGDNLKSAAQRRSRVIIQPKQPGGKDCDISNMAEISQCLSEEGAKDLQEKLVPTKTTEGDQVTS